MVITKNPRLIIIIPFYNAREYIKECIDSVSMQTYTNWIAVCTDDNSDDSSSNVIPSDPRIIKRNSSQRMRQLAIIYEAIVHSGVEYDEDDVICTLDGDDHLLELHSLEIVAGIYRGKPNCLLTYEQYITSSGKPSHSKPYTRNEFDVLREKSFGASHFRTFKWRLCREFLRQDPEVLSYKDDKGNFFLVAPDLAIMLFLMEIAGYPNIIFNKIPIYWYCLGVINWFLSAMSNGWIYCSNGDIFFRLGWLENNLAIFDAFPFAGLVFAQPTLFDTLRGTGHAYHQLEIDKRYRYCHIIASAESVREYSWGFVLNANLEKELMETPVRVAEEKASRTRAVVGGAHNQFLVRREVARQIVPLPSQYALSPIEDSAFNRRVDDLGLLQLSTFEPFTFHVGIGLDEWTQREIDCLGLEEVLAFSSDQRDRSLPASLSWSKKRTLPLLEQLSRLEFLDKLLRRAYNLLFEFLRKIMICPNEFLSLPIMA